MKKLTMARARQLVERELGIKVKELTMPDSYNGNPDFPWYELRLGNQTITVTYAGYGPYSKGNELINLSVTHENSSSYVSEYYYADTLEYCEEYTEKNKYEVLCDRMGITDTDAKLERLSYEASDAMWRHYHLPIKKIKQNADSEQHSNTHFETNIPVPNSTPHDIHSEAAVFNAMFDGFEGKLLQGHTMFKLMAFDLGGKYFTESGYFDESELEWWCREVKSSVLNMQNHAAGFTVYVWNREIREWSAYSPDGKHVMTFDTGRRQDGLHETLKQEINFSAGPESTDIESNEQEEVEEGPELEG